MLQTLQYVTYVAWWYMALLPALNSTTLHAIPLSTEGIETSFNRGTWAARGAGCPPGSATWPQLGPIWEQVRPKSKSIWPGHCRSNPKFSKRPFSLVFSSIFHVFLLLMTLHLKQCSPCCAVVGPNSVWSCRLRCRTDLDFHVHHMASM